MTPEVGSMSYRMTSKKIQSKQKHRQHCTLQAWIAWNSNQVGPPMSFEPQPDRMMSHQSRPCFFVNWIPELVRSQQAMKYHENPLDPPLSVSTFQHTMETSLDPHLKCYHLPALKPLWIWRSRLFPPSGISWNPFGSAPQVFSPSSIETTLNLALKTVFPPSGISWNPSGFAPQVFSVSLRRRWLHWGIPDIKRQEHKQHLGTCR